MSDRLFCWRVDGIIHAADLTDAYDPMFNSDPAMPDAHRGDVLVAVYSEEPKADPDDDTIIKCSFQEWVSKSLSLSLLPWNQRAAIGVPICPHCLAQVNDDQETSERYG